MKRNVAVAWLLLLLTFLLPVLLIRGEPLAGGEKENVDLLPMHQAGSAQSSDGQRQVKWLLEDGGVETLTRAD